MRAIRSATSHRIAACALRRANEICVLPDLYWRDVYDHTVRTHASFHAHAFEPRKHIYAFGFCARLSSVCITSLSTQRRAQSVMRFFHLANAGFSRILAFDVEKKPKARALCVLRTRARKHTAHELYSSSSPFEMKTNIPQQHMSSACEYGMCDRIINHPLTPRKDGPGWKGDEGQGERERSYL